MNLKCRNVEGSHKLVHQFRHQVDICFVTPLWRIEELYQSKSLQRRSNLWNKGKKDNAQGTCVAAVMETTKLGTEEQERFTLRPSARSTMRLPLQKFMRTA